MSARPSMANSGLSVRGEDLSPFFAPSGGGGVRGREAVKISGHENCQ